jgi:hypothetical protein
MMEVCQWGSPLADDVDVAMGASKVFEDPNLRGREKSSTTGGYWIQPGTLIWISFAALVSSESAGSADSNGLTQAITLLECGVEGGSREVQRFAGNVSRRIQVTIGTRRVGCETFGR